MAKKDFIQLTKADETARRIHLLYLKAIRNILNDVKDIPNIIGSPFDIGRNPYTKDWIDRELRKLTAESVGVINQATNAQWLSAYEKNMDIAKPFLARKLLTEAQQKAYLGRNLEALKSFQARKIGGLSLSQKVWKYNLQFRGEIEMGLDTALREGGSAQTISRKLRGYLQEPERLFRKVADEHGHLHLSKMAKKYSPGKGAYRSSYKNAMRLARTEVNMAYRASDHEKYKQFDFVYGFEVKRSNRAFGCGVCEELKGKYPKDFKFVGWHPQCRCYTVPLLNSEDAFVRAQQAILKGEQPLKRRQIKNPPQGFLDWFASNKSKLQVARSVPYFITDNKKLISTFKKGKATEKVTKIPIQRYSWKHQDIDSAITEMTAISRRSADDYYRPNAGKFWVNATETDKDILFKYTGGAHRDIDAPYIKGQKPEIDGLNLEKAIAKSSFKDGRMLKRGTGPNGFSDTFGITKREAESYLSSSTVSEREVRHNLVGKRGTMKGFSSCGASGDTGFSKDFMLYIEAPPKTPMTYLEPVSKFGDGVGRGWDGIKKQTRISSEQEVLLQANTKLEIVSLKRKYGKLEIYARVIK